MEILAMTQIGILIELPETKKRTIIPYGELFSSHPIITDALSFKLGYLAALDGLAAANDE